MGGDDERRTDGQPDEPGLSETPGKPGLSNHPDESRLSERPDERELLLAALDRGYFDVPQGVTAADLAAETALSVPAVKARLARGMATLMTEHGHVPENGRRPFEFPGPG